MSGWWRCAGRAARGAVLNLAWWVVVAARGAEAAPSWLPVPIRAVAVLENARVQGQPVQVRAVGSPESCALTLARVRAHWRSMGWPVGADAWVAGWRVIGAAPPGAFLTAQWHESPEGGCEGLLSVWPWSMGESRPAPADPTVPVPDGVHWRGRLEQTAPGPGAVFIGETRRPLGEIVSTLRQRLREAGWQLTQDRSAAGGASLEASAGGVRGTWLLTGRHDGTELVLITDRSRP